MHVDHDSPAGAKLAARFWIELGRQRQHKAAVPGWAARMDSLMEQAGFGYAEFREFLLWVSNENAWTAENLRVARDPMGSLEKQFDNCLRRWVAKRKAQAIRDKRAAEAAGESRCYQLDWSAAPEPAASVVEHGLLFKAERGGHKGKWLLGKSVDDWAYAFDDEQAAYDRLVAEPDDGALVAAALLLADEPVPDECPDCKARPYRDGLCLDCWEEANEPTDTTSALDSPDMGES
jgi:hypothetical protein